MKSKLKLYHVLVVAAIGIGMVYVMSCGTKDPVSPPATIPGGTIVYVKQDTVNGYGIYSMDAGGGNRKTILDTDDDEMIPHCACDGSIMAFIWNKNNINEMYTINIDGTNPQPLANDGINKFCPRWSPGDSMIAFHRKSLPNDNTTDIWVLHIGSGTLRQITTDTLMDVSPSWSPDGKSLIFASNRSDSLYDIYSVGIQQGSVPVMLIEINELYDPAPQYSHNGQWIAYISEDLDFVETDLEVFKMRADGTGEPIQLTHNTHDDYTPCWSPDDAWIAFRSVRTGPARYDICRIRADGTGFTNMTNDLASDAWPDWRQ